jgi:anti-anti-sigma factor
VLAEPGPGVGIWVLRVAGPMDAQAIGAAREALVRALAGKPRLVVVDLRRMTRIDNAGVVLLAAMRRYARRAGSRLSIVDRRAYTGRGHCGLAATLPVYRSIAAAIR